jgi:hypothetical protein
LYNQLEFDMRPKFLDNPPLFQFAPRRAENAVRDACAVQGFTTHPSRVRPRAVALAVGALLGAAAVLFVIEVGAAACGA